MTVLLVGGEFAMLHCPQRHVAGIRHVLHDSLATPNAISTTGMYRFAKYTVFIKVSLDGHIRITYVGPSQSRQDQVMRLDY